MKIFKICVENYRLLNNFSIDLEEDLSLIVGKNNTGKTSILLVLNKFLSGNEKFKISWDDLNINCKKEICDLIEDKKELDENDYKDYGIKLKLFIEYGELDDLTNISRVMMDLDPESNVIVLGFEYVLGIEDFKRLKIDFVDFHAKELAKDDGKGYKPKTLTDFLNQNHEKYFLPYKKSFAYDKEKRKINELIFIDLDSEKVSVNDIINFKFISAKRDVTNKDVDKTLSGQTSRIYQRTEESAEQLNTVEKFKDSLSTTDAQLSKLYNILFNDIIQKVKDFGGIRPNDSDILIISTLQHRELLAGNTTVVYSHDESNRLPENYNGLGYMNLISMIFEIEILVQEFKRDKQKKPADINLLFIEEPEAHTHPQMQYVFIKNIKQLLREGIKREDGENRKLQYIVTTHSSHIVADSVFSDVKYLKRESNFNVSAKNLKDLHKEYDVDSIEYDFLKQYLTISRAEIFFADKAVLIEGDTERLLVPTMMRKLDIDEKIRLDGLGEKEKFLPLLSQNISVIEVGAYSKIFEKFIDFLGIKTLVITDLDTVDEAGEKCRVDVGVNYSNYSIEFFFDGASLQDLKRFDLQNKIFSKVEGKWIKDNNGKLCVVYQTNENGVNARSFEDAFINLNKDFIIGRIRDFKGIKHSRYFFENNRDSYDLAENCIKKKTHFALDILYNSDHALSRWHIPNYIKQGLLWLKQD